MELKRQGLTTYALWKRVEDEVAKTSVFQFMNGNTDMKSDLLGHLLDALDLTIVSKGAGLRGASRRP